MSLKHVYCCSMWNGSVYNGAAQIVSSLMCCDRGIVTPGRTYEMLIDTEVDVGDVTEVTFQWNNPTIFNPMNPKYGASMVELQSKIQEDVS